MCHLDSAVSHDVTAKTNLPVVTSVAASYPSITTIPNSSLVCLHIIVATGNEFVMLYEAGEIELGNFWFCTCFSMCTVGTGVGECMQKEFVGVS